MLYTYSTCLLKMAMSTKVLIFVLGISLMMSVVNSIEFQVGDNKGWTIPNVRQEDRDFYNDWASKHRFKVNDTIRFKYEKDSVLVVEEIEYDKCKAAKPIFFSNNEDTVFTLDRSGLFYFISGVAGHCERGQKMIIKVLEEQKQQEAGRSSPGPSSSVPATNQNQTSGTTTTAPSTAAVSASASSSGGAAALLMTGVVLVVPFLG